MNKFQEIQNHYDVLRRLWWNYWTQEVVFTHQWWIMIFIMIITVFLWWKFVDKTRMIEISLVGLISAGISFVLDQIGASLGYWTYPFTISHLERDLFAVADLSIIPFFYTMIYQWFPKWKPYLLGILIFALFSAFVGEYLFIWLGIYVILKWKHIYSVPFYFLIGIFIKAVLQKFNSIEAHSKSKI